MNKVRRLAEDLVNRHPALFSGDFDKNKQALSQVTIIRTRSIRNQLAGAITKIVHERGPLEVSEKSGEIIEQKGEGDPSSELATLEERAKIEGTPVPKIEQQVEEKRALESGEATASARVRNDETSISESKPMVQ